eukprot:9994257-Alexandrium_andersonii.AAC.1
MHANMNPTPARPQFPSWATVATPKCTLGNRCGARFLNCQRSQRSPFHARGNAKLAVGFITEPTPAAATERGWP